jgi:hypothetical protein
MRNKKRVPEGKRPLGRSRRRWLDSVKIDLEGVEGIHLAQDRDRWAFFNTVMNLRLP